MVLRERDRVPIMTPTLHGVQGYSGRNQVPWVPTPEHTKVVRFYTTLGGTNGTI